MLRSSTFAVLFLSCKVLSQAVTINAPATLPSGASQVISHDFPSLACEVASFPDYPGNISHPRTASRNLVENLSNKTGQPIVFRVGGTSGDHDHFDPNQPTAIIRPSIIDPSNPLFNISLGPAFFDGFKTFPNTKFIFQVPAGTANAHLSADAIAQTKAAVAAISAARIDSLEIGNEPDLYAGQKVTPLRYNLGDYVKNFLQYTADVNGNITTLDKKIYQALTFSWGHASDWDQSAAFRDGINKTGSVKSVSFHHYQTRTTDPTVTLKKNLMNHTEIVNGLAQFIPDIAYLKQNNPDIAFHLGEVGSVLNTPDHDDNAIAGVLGSALWVVDYMLYAMSMNIDRVNMQQGTGFAYSFWQPVPLKGTEKQAPHIRAPYYGLIFIAEFIGGTSNLQIKNIDLESDTLSAYVGYSFGTVAKIAVVNFEQWNETDTDPRPIQNLTITGFKDGQKVSVTKLTGPGASSFNGTNFGGVEYTWENQGMPSMAKNSTEILTVSNGNLALSVQASEAVLVQAV